MDLCAKHKRVESDKAEAEGFSIFNTVHAFFPVLALACLVEILSSKVEY